MAETITISDEKKESPFFTYEDLQAAIKRGGKGIPPTKQYDPKIFWDSMGDKFYRAFDRPEKCAFGAEYFVDRLRSLQPISSLLEVGCGFGRLAPFLLQAKVIESYTGIELSETVLKGSESYLEPTTKDSSDIQKLESFFSNGNLSDQTKQLAVKSIGDLIDSLKEKASKLGKSVDDYRSKIKLSSGDARLLQFEDNSFDCVISSECIQHMNFDDAYKACQEMSRVSKKHLVLLERWAFPGEHSEPHIWSHNYSEIFNDLGLDVLQVTTIAQGLQGVVVGKR